MTLLYLKKSIIVFHLCIHGPLKGSVFRLHTTSSQDQHEGGATPSLRSADMSTKLKPLFSSNDATTRISWV